MSHFKTYVSILCTILFIFKLMSIRQSSEISIRCSGCKYSARSFKPVVIKNEDGNRFHI